MTVRKMMEELSHFLGDLRVLLPTGMNFTDPIGMIEAKIKPIKVFGRRYYSPCTNDDPKGEESALFLGLACLP